nr:NanT5 [Kibdelosporangium sp. MJ126-NF4]
MRDLTVSRLSRGFRLANLVMVLVVLAGLALPTLLTDAAVYHSFAAQVIAFLTDVVVAAIVGLHIRRERFGDATRWALLVLTVAAYLVATTGVPTSHQVAQETDWSFGVVGWLGLLVLLDRTVLGSVLFLAAVNVFSAGYIVVIGEDVLRFAVGAILVLGFQLAFVAAAAALGRFAASASLAVHDAQRLRTAEAVADQVQADRKARYAGLAETTVPLLDELASGRADLRDDGTRARYAVEAARMRRLFAENDDVGDPLVHELKACVDIAERKGVAVHLDTWGEHPVPPVAIRRTLVEPVVRSLATAVATARVTVLGSGNAVTVSVVTDSRVPVGEVGDPPVTVTTTTADGLTWVEATWWT